MARIRLIAASLLAAAFLLVPLSAYATGPVLAPSQVLVDGFESAVPARTIAPVPLLGVAPTAYWGVVSQSRRSGSSGLWCAGGTGGFWASQYPSGTRGVVYWGVPQLSDYYSSNLSFWYTMPSLGSADAENFWVRWETAAQPSNFAVKYPFPTTSTWSQLAWDLSSDASIDMSREGGTVEVWFENAPGGDPNNPNIGSSTGQGPTIDDLAITGWKFGPVRNLALDMNGATAHLTWDTPWRSTEGTSTEERPIAYRVYREVDGSDAWVELTSDQITGNSFDDAGTAALSGTYRYIVQAEDQGTVTGYGQVDVAGSPTHVFVPAADAPIFTITGLPAGPTASSVTPGYATTETPAPSVAATLDGAPFSMGGAVTAEGTHTLTVRLTGSGGAASEHTVQFTIDKTAPITGNNAPSGTQLTAIAVTLTSSDAISGVAHTYYRIDSATKTPTLYTAPLNIGWGDHTIYYYSVDAAGNVETQKSVKVSLRQPTTISIAASPSAGTRKHAQTLYGYVSPGTHGYKVTVQYQKPGSSKWYTAYVYTVTSGSKGKWSYRYTPTIHGTYHWKVSWAGNSTRYKSVSKTLSVAVK